MKIVRQGAEGRGSEIGSIFSIENVEIDKRGCHETKRLLS